MQKKLFSFVLLLGSMILQYTAVAQPTVPHEIISSNADNNDSINLLQYGRHKQLPHGFEMEALEALSHFPELKNVTIKFKIRKSFSTLKTRPNFISVFMPKGHRTYSIIISNKTIDKLMPLTFAHLSHEARVGVIGHELSHVADLSARTTWQCLRVGIGHLSPAYLDRFEYNTDLICIRHGLGKELEAWSSYIRNTIHTSFSRGAGYVNKTNTRHERYMNPATIEKNM